MPTADSAAGSALCVLDDALEALARIDPRRARVIELRFFGGLSVEETAESASDLAANRDARLAAGQSVARARAARR
jgi:DNA-directed RNA polymerase specialized sigma24 family protein